MISHHFKPLLELHRLAAAAEVAVAALGDDEFCLALSTDIAFARLVSQLSHSPSRIVLRQFYRDSEGLSTLWLETHEEAGLAQRYAVEQDGGGVLAGGLYRDAEGFDPSLEQNTLVPLHPLRRGRLQRYAGGL